MTTGDESDTAPLSSGSSTGEPVPHQGSFRTPAEYYSSPAPPRLPSWVPIGCGVASLVVLAALFIGGAFLRTGGVSKLVGFVLSTTESQLDAIASPEVSPESRAALKKELASLRAHVDRGDVNLAEIQEFQKSISRAIRDQKLTKDEVDDLTAKSREINRRARSKSTEPPDSV